MDRTREGLEDEIIQLKGKVMDLEAKSKDGEHIRDLFQNMEAGVWVLDSDFNVQMINQRLCKLLKVTESSAIGEKCYNILDRDMCSTDLCPLKRVVRGNCKTTDKTKKNGIPLFVTSFPFKDEDGNLKGVMEEFHIENDEIRKNETYRLLVENSQDVVYRVSIPDGRCEYVNPSCTRIFGHTPEEFYKNPLMIKDLLTPKWKKRFDKVWSERLTGKIRSPIEYQIVHKSGKVRWMTERDVLIRDADGNPVALQGIIIDMTPHKKFEEAESRLAAIVEHSHDGVVSYDINWKIQSWNHGAEKVYGYRKDEVLGKSVSILIPSEKRDELDSLMKKVLKGSIIEKNDALRVKKDGRLVHVSLTISPLKDARGRIVGASTIVRDITWRRNAQMRIRNSEEHYKHLVESVPVGIVQVTQRGNVMDANPKFLEMMGSDSESYSQPFNLYKFAPAVESGCTEKFMECFETGQNISGECNPTINGKTMKLQYNLTPFLGSSNKVESVLGTMSDITALKDAEKKLKESLKEKDILMKEIHHRVKNNLTVISSLLNLQSHQIKDQEALNLFRDSQSRARSMALIHKELYSGNFKRVNFGDYIKNLVSDLFGTYNIHDNVKLEMDIDDITLDVDVSVPLGLIINELISNSLKYAFPKGEDGVLTVEFHRENDKYVLTIRDNGVGLPEGLELGNTDSLGLQLVKSLTDQLDGSLQIVKTNGTCFRISFREPEFS